MRPGQLVERYRIESELGRGGMGRVYCAFDPKLERRVAIKLLSAERAPEEAIGLVLREARAAAALDHECAVKVFDVGEFEGQPFIVMELVTGRSLRGLVSSDEPWPRRLRWLVDVARALEAAHRAGLVHRDVKPENVMVRADGTVKVLDFGIARRRLPDGSVKDTDNRAAAVIGTPDYMAPEQILSRQTTPKSDQFSWGVMAYEILSGQVPFAATSPIQVLALIAHRPAMPLGERSPELPSEVAGAVDRALSKKPDQRWPSMADLAEHLAGFTEPAAKISVDSLPDSGLAHEDTYAPTVPVVVTPDTSSHRTTSDAGSLVAPPIPDQPVAPAPTARRPWIALVLGAWVLLLTVVYFAWRSAAPEPGAASSAPSASAVASQPGLLGLPIPTQCTPECVAEYQSGLGFIREGNWEQAHRRFLDATAKDPSCAEAHLRLAMTSRQHDTPTRARESFQQAIRLRDRLGERDRKLLEAHEPLLGRDPPDRRELSRRLVALAEAYPSDAEILTKVAYHATNADLATRLAAAKNAAAIDPGFSDAWQAVGLLEAESGNTESALSALAECIRIAPASTDCLLTRIWIQAERGACTEMEDDARQWIARSPSTALGLLARAEAMTALLRPREAVEQLLAQRWNKLAAPERAHREPYERAATAILYGDLEAALSSSAELLEAVKSETNLEPHVRATLLRVELLVELGEREPATNLIGSYLRGRSAFSSSVGSDRDLLAMIDEPRLIGLGRELGADPGSAAQLKAHAERLDAEALLNPWARWAFAAAAVTSAEEAAAHVVRAPGPLPPAGPVRVFGRGSRSGLTHAFAGRAALLSGRVEVAIPFLRAATTSCVPFAAAIVQMQSHLHLGEALERSKDIPGACSAYGKVLERWGANPRSVTRRRAAERRQALRCK